MHPPLTLAPDVVPSIRARRPAGLVAVVAVVAALLPALRPAVADARPATVAPAAPGYGIPVAGDWDGDGIDTIAWFDRGVWTVYPDHQGKGEPVRFQYGVAGDRPVAGDWDGDGRDGIGVARGGAWYLRPTATPGASTARLAFGLSSDVAVAGDWDGDGRDGIGVVRGGAWYLRPTVTSTGTVSAGFRFGSATDQPVVGDWGHTGRDGIGVLRGRTWLLRPTASPGAASSTTMFGRAGDKPTAGDWDGDGLDGIGAVRAGVAFLSARPARDDDQGVAVPWLVAADAAGCPAQPAPNVGGWVVPPLHLDLHVVPTDPTDQTARAALADAMRWQLGPEFATVWAAQSGKATFDARGPVLGRSAAETDLRRPAMAAESIAVAIRTDVPLPRSRPFAIEHVRRLIRSLACEHRATLPGGWPDAKRDGGGSFAAASWQSALWARDVAQAGWLLWDRLAPGERNAVAAMVIDEANRLTATPPATWTNSLGTIVTPGNTGFEEVAWNQSLLMTALAMMPGHPNAPAWRVAAIRYAVTATATVEDLATRRSPPASAASASRRTPVAVEVVDGKLVSSWITGANIRSDGTVDNHGVHGHPDYSSCLRDLLGSALIATLGAVPATPGTTRHAALIYDALADVSFPAGGSVFLDTQGDVPGAIPSPPFDEPGGTIYRSDGSVYYPRPSVWGGVGRARFAALDELVATLDLAPGARGWTALHGAAAAALQARTGDGRTFVSASEFPYAANEEFEASALAQWWLSAYLRLGGIPIEIAP